MLFRSQLAALDLSSWRVAGCGAEPIRADSLNEFAAHFASCGFKPSAFVPSYGLAEHALAVTLGHRGLHIDVVDADTLNTESRAVPAKPDAPSVRLVACGTRFPDHQLRILDDDGRELPDRHVGSIVVSGPSVMAGYFENPEATDAVLNDGWLRTGDLGDRKSTRLNSSH